MNRIILTVFIICSTQFTHAQNNVPKVKDVLQAFYSRYDLSNSIDPNIYLEKKNNSWYVYTYSLDNDRMERLNRQLFYDAGGKKYLDLNFTKSKNDSLVDISDVLRVFDQYNFDVHSSYGYEGWYHDVIAQLEAEQQLTVDEKNSLARSYTAAANALLGNQFGDVVPSETFQAPLKSNSLTPEQFKAFMDKSNRSIQLYKEMAASDPEFETVVGNIHQKVANEIMWQYHSMLVYAGNLANEIELPDEIYHADTLESVRKTLEACPQDAILLSYGDNDFYPVMYLQAKGLRRDVYLINYNLSAYDRFIFHYTQPQFDAMPIKLSFDTLHYRGDTNNYLMLAGTDESKDFSEVVELIKSGEAMGNVPTTVILNGERTEDETIQNEVQLFGNYIFREQWIMLDIINNLEGRKICFPTPFFDQLTGLNEYLVAEGSLYIYNN